MSVFPLIVVAFSGPILNEKIGIQRWLAVGFGFIGIIIILDPSKFIFNSDISLGFEDEENSGDFDLSWVSIRSSLISVTIKGVGFKLGSSKSDLKNYTYNADASSFVFTDADTGSVSLFFHIGKDERIKEIKFVSEN